MDKYEQKLGGFLVEFIEKADEKRVFFSARSIPQQGKRGEPLTKDQETAAVMLGKEWFEQNRGVMLLNFHKDPLAGGMRAAVPPKGQLWRSGVVRKEVFAQHAKGAVSQGKVGEIVEENRPSNIERGNSTMIATPLWTAEWL